MIKRIYYNFAVTFIALGLLVGCKSLTPVESTQLAGDEIRTLISEHVADETRAKQLIEMVDQLENDLMAYVEIQTAHNDALRRKNADYNATREDMQNLYDAYNRDTRAISMKMINTHLEMTKLATSEEWAVISKPKHRIGGF